LTKDEILTGLTKDEIMTGFAECRSRERMKDIG